MESVQAIENPLAEPAIVGSIRSSRSSVIFLDLFFRYLIISLFNYFVNYIFIVLWLYYHAA